MKYRRKSNSILPQLGIDNEVIESFCYFCCFNIGSIKLCIRIPTTGFVPGQSIETAINLNNTSSIDVTKICFKLQRVSSTAIIVVTSQSNYDAIVETFMTLWFN